MARENGYYFKNFMKYSNELSKSMKFLSKNKNVIFLGQSVNFSGNAIYNTLKSISPPKKKLRCLYLRMFKWV